MPVNQAKSGRHGIRLFAAQLVCAALLASGCAATSAGRPLVTQETAPPSSPLEQSPAQQLPSPAPPVAIEEIWGVQVVSIRRTAAGNLIDFRCRVVDAKKAAPLLDRKVKPVLVDASTGARASVVSSPKVGSLRTTGPVSDGLQFFVLFGNPSGYFKPGAKVTVEIGEFRAVNLTVE